MSTLRQWYTDGVWEFFRESYSTTHTHHTNYAPTEYRQGRYGATLAFQRRVSSRHAVRERRGGADRESVIMKGMRNYEIK